MTTGPLDRTIGPPLHLQIGPSRGGQLARLSCLKQLQGKITELVLFVISFPISFLAALRFALLTNENQEAPTISDALLAISMLINLFHISNNLFWNLVNICIIFQQTRNRVLDTNIAEYKNHIKDSKCRRLVGRYPARCTCYDVSPDSRE